MAKFIVLPLAATVLVFASCGREAKVVEADAKPAPVSVAVARAAREDLSRELTLAAEFRPYQEIELHAKVAGYVKNINVDVGDHVKQGQLIAVLEIPEMTEDLEQASAAKQRSEAEVVRARGDVARAESAHALAHLSYSRLAAVVKSRPNLIAEQEIDDAQAKDHIAEAQVSAAKAALAAAGQQVAVSRAGESRVKTMSAYSRITAPFSGVITKRYADTGAMIQAGIASQTQTMPLVRLSQIDRLRLVLPVPESIAARIRIGGTVQVKVPALARSFEGRVARFSARVAENTRTMETEVDVANPQSVLLPGMYAEAALTLDRRPDALAVPVEAIANHDTRPTVMIVNARGEVEEHPVRIGIETPSKVEVLGGLNEGDMVITGGRGRVRAGQQVKPKLLAAAVVKETR